MRHLTIIMAAALAASPAAALAGDEPTVDAKGATPTAEVHIDTTIPANPGLAVIALTPTKVIDPSALRLASLDVSEFVDDHGKVKDGLAFAFAPYFWINRRETLQAYQDKVDKDPLTRAISLTTLSIGYVRKTDSQSERVGVGFATELLGRQQLRDGSFVYSDYRLDGALSKCITDAYIKVVGRLVPQRDLEAVAKLEWDEAQARAGGGRPVDLPALSKPIPGGFASDLGSFHTAWVGARITTLKEQDRAALDQTALNAGMASPVGACRSEAHDRHDRRQSLVFAGGGVVLPNPRPGERNTDGGSLWLSYRRSLGLGLANYLTLFGRNDFDRHTDTPTGRQDFNKSSAALLLGYERKLADDDKLNLARVSLEAGYERLDYRHGGPLKDDDAGYYALTADIRIFKNTYVEVKAGTGSLEVGAKGKADKITLAIRRGL